MHKRSAAWFGLGLLVAGLATPAQEIVWQVGQDDNGWPQGGVGGGPEANFVQEAGTNELPGNPFNEPINGQSDDDYYFEGIYDNVIPGNGDYVPVGVVPFNEESAERAFAGTDNDLRYHFNLPETLQPTDLLSVTFDIFNLDQGASATDPRYGIEVYVNGVLVQEEIVIRPGQLDTDYTTPQFTLESVGAVAGPGYDNIVRLKGISYNNDGGGAWMGIDYVQLNHDTDVIPPGLLPWSVGMDDDGWPEGDGGGENATFVQENGEVNELPGSPDNEEVHQQADNDYYFAGSYTTVIEGNGDYVPVGLVPAHEEAAERALTPDNSELRYHFNLPNSVIPSDRLEVAFDAFNLDDTAANPRYGVEVYVNNVLVQSEVIIGADQVGVTQVTAPFTAGSANLEVGPGFDNIITLRGIDYSGDGGGNWIGIDYVELRAAAKPIPPAVVPFAIGMNDNGWPDLNGGGVNAAFVQENGEVNPLPGTPLSPKQDQQADNDYYLAGLYTTVIEGNGEYEPVGPVPEHEEAAERALTPGDSEQRYHFNLPANLTPSSQLSVSFDAINLDESGGDPKYGVEIYVNGVRVQEEILVTFFDLGTVYNTEPFTLESVNAEVGPGFDNILTLKGIDYEAEGGGAWMGIDFVQVNPVLPPPFPWQVGKDDNGHPAGNGGGPETTFVQETGGVNMLPGSPTSPETHQQADNDYYFAGEYTTALDAIMNEYGFYDPVGTVVVNEEAAERAFAGGDNDLRYHFNLPSTLSPQDLLVVSFDALSLHTDPDVAWDPRWGAEIWVNGVKVMDEVIIRPSEFDVDFMSEPFTLESVGAVVGPGADNIVSLKGISYNADGGGNWMGIDYVALDPMPTPVFPWAVGRDDNDWPVGDGGGANATFVQENGTVNFLPGSPSNIEVNQQADNDYYLAGEYNTAIESVTTEYGFYEPLGLVLRNEEAAERAITVGNTELRYHFNLPASMQPTDEISVTFDARNLHIDEELNPDPRWGIEVLINGVLVQEEIVIRPAQLDTDFTTPPVTLAEVNAEVGLGADNIVTLRGVDYSWDGGGNWIGIDYVRMHGPEEEAPEFVSIEEENGQITLSWTGGGVLEWAPSVDGPWSPVNPAPDSTYSEAIVPTQNRFYRLVNP